MIIYSVFVFDYIREMHFLCLKSILLCCQKCITLLFGKWCFNLVGKSKIIGVEKITSRCFKVLPFVIFFSSGVLFFWLDNEYSSAQWLSPIFSMCLNLLFSIFMERQFKQE